ncbi:MAG: hypothetical protein A3F46_00965 [Legionellales bacterium RIFCSPHIGHO2_12_FULL_42_9]|nr:MAG: hypothetical protein A3F46_00965 [Legionellales bacterium RIFCSPHIGHO2_12_FULL_42_9]
MTTHEKRPVEEVARLRSKVEKPAKFKAVQDKLLLGGVLVVCGIIAGVGFLPSHKKETIIEAQEKQNTDQTLSQNMALLAQLKSDSATVQPVVTSYYGDSNGNHPPKLKNDNYLSKELLARMNAPSTFYSDTNVPQSKQSATAQGTHATLTGKDGNSEFLNQQEDITSVSAKQLPHPRLTIPAGEMIPATLETAINSDLAGMARAIITRDVYSLEGNNLLIHKGATLVGQFNSTITQGQSRVFVVWNRVQMTNGVIVTLNSPSTDTIGRSGQAADYINRHFFERFGTGALLSVLGGYAAAGGVNGQDEYNSVAQYRMNIANNFQQTANQTLQKDIQINTTLQVNQGTQINVFVAHDLDFYRVYGKRA